MRRKLAQQLLRGKCPSLQLSTVARSMLQANIFLIGFYSEFCAFFSTKQHQYEYEFAERTVKPWLKGTAEIKRKQNFIHNCLKYPPLKTKRCQTVLESLTNYNNL